MCGITGILSRAENAALLPWIANMHHQQAHRGQDDHGFLFLNVNERSTTATDLSFTPNVAFAHQRLAVQDLTIAGHQPMVDDTSRYTIVFNGEVYNFKDIRTDLEKEKVFFFSKTDTEVVLRAYIQWGAACLHRFEGMFAFTIWDAKKQELFMARDRFGVKPFYYLKKEGVLAFSSEIKAFKGLPFFNKSLSKKAVYDYLIKAEVERDGLSLFEEITELLPGHYAVFNRNSFVLEEVRWYELPAVSSEHNHEGLVASKVRRLVDASIRHRLISDVPVGTCLSGGLDSSIIVASMLGQTVKPSAFTATFEGFERDESKYAKEFEKEVNWIKTSPSASDFKNEIEKVIWTQDIPFFSSSTFIQYKVMQLVGESKIKVTLDGQGADELFGGYARHYAALVNENYKAGRWSEAWQLRKNANPYFCSKNTVTREFVKQFVQKPNKYKQLFSKDLLSENVITYKSEALTLNAYLKEGIEGTVLKNLLRTGDRNSMAHTVEARMPFADSHELTEYALTIDPNLKIKGGIGKHILREAYRDSVPAIILDRRDKIGFEAPQKEWFKALKPFVKSVFPTADDDFINWSAIHNDFDVFYDDQIEKGRLELWRLFNFQLWRMQWGV